MKVVPVISFVGKSGTGMTTFLVQVVAELERRGRRVAVIKHDVHGFDVDQPGKDSWRHREAGCTEVLVSSAHRYALMHELRGAHELSLPGAIGLLAPCALVLVEGYKTHPLPKLEIWRPAVGKPQLHPRDPHVLAVATDAPSALAECRLPVFGLNQPDEIASFVVAHAVVLPLGIDAPGRSE